MDLRKFVSDSLNFVIIKDCTKQFVYKFVILQKIQSFSSRVNEGHKRSQARWKPYSVRHTLNFTLVLFYKDPMIQSFLKILLLCCVALPAIGVAQHIEFGNILSSSIENRDKQKVGRGGMQYVSGRLTLPLSIKRDAERGIRTWLATLSGKYAHLNNKEGAALINPDKIVNTGLMLTHIRTIAPRWNMIAMTGVSLNAPSDYIRTNSLSLTAGALFSYHVNQGLNMGVGIIVTTNYGDPICIPVPFITWKKSGKINYELNMRGMPEFRISSQLTPKFLLALSPFDAERFSAVVKHAGTHKLYTNNLIKTSLEGSYHIAKHVSLNAEAAYVYYHKTKLIDRSARAFWKNLFSNKNALKYSPTWTLSVGLQYRFR